jgi:hypothetical protein
MSSMTYDIEIERFGLFWTWTVSAIHPRPFYCYTGFAFTKMGAKVKAEKHAKNIANTTKYKLVINNESQD